MSFKSSLREGDTGPTEQPVFCHADITCRADITKNPGQENIWGHSPYQGAPVGGVEWREAPGVRDTGWGSRVGRCQVVGGP